MQISMKLSVSGLSVEPGSIIMEECSGCHKLKDVDEMSQCVECGGYICSGPTCDCVCPVVEYEDESDA